MVIFKNLKNNSNKKSDIKKISIYKLLIGLVFILLINILSGFINFRLDITSEKRYTLSPATKSILKDLDDIVYFKIYLDGDLPSGFVRLQKETEEMLNQFRAYSNKVFFEFSNPYDITDTEQRDKLFQQIVTEGINPTELQVKSNDGGITRKFIFPGGVANYKNKQTSFQLIENQAGKNSELALNSSVENLEYTLANSLRKLTGKAKPRIAFIDGHGELPPLYTQGATNALSEFYVVERVEINGQISALTERHAVGDDTTNYSLKNKYSAIIVAKPNKVFDKNERDKFIIDQYIMNGGKVLWLVDGVNAEMDSLQAKSQTIGLSNDINLNDLFFNYGVRINSDLITDLNAMPIPVVVDNNGTQRLIPWIYMPIILPTSNHPISRNLNLIKTEFISSIDTIESANIKKTFLLTTSQYSKVHNAPVMINLESLFQQPDARQFNDPYKNVAILLEGEFVSLFHNRVTEEILFSPEIKFISKSKPTAQIVVSDGDIIKNQIHYQASGPVALPLGFDKYNQQQFGNSDFILNCIDYLCDESRLYELRSRKLELRLLDTLKTKNKTKWQLINIIIPISIVAIAGIIQYFVRKKKYSR